MSELPDRYAITLDELEAGVRVPEVARVQEQAEPRGGEHPAAGVVPPGGGGHEADGD